MNPPAGTSAPRNRRGRLTHPLAWWVWAGGAAVALTRVGNPLVLAGLIAGVVLTAVVCREPVGRGGSVFSRTLEAALIIGGVIILVRAGFYILVGFPDSTRVLVHLPSFDLPWFTNLHVLGPLHFGGLVHALIEGLRLAGLVVTFGAASAVSNPRRALRHLPSSLHHLGTAAVIAVAAAPQLVASVGRIRRAQQLRAPAPGKQSRFRRLGAVLIPVLAGALDQSLALAGSMDSRGYARATSSARGVGAALVVALLAAAAGTYGLLDTTTPPGLGLGLLTGGFALAAGASVVASRSVARTRYWTTPWGWREMVATASGIALATVALLGGAGLGAWRASDPWPSMPLLGLVMILAALAPLLTRIRIRAASKGASRSRPRPAHLPGSAPSAPDRDPFPGPSTAASPGTRFPGEHPQ